ncbi:MAG TPA: hypothetical protein VIA06_17915 [Candidatus Dormibacteraeota bacterium]|jgi:hypothetical protein|nr:hypothetical protein [Candidatus Dormibacteraeota bacterium]
MRRLVRCLPLVALWMVLVALGYDFSVASDTPLPGVMGTASGAVAGTAVVVLFFSRR